MCIKFYGEHSAFLYFPEYSLSYCNPLMLRVLGVLASLLPITKSTPGVLS